MNIIYNDDLQKLFQQLQLRNLRWFTHQVMTNNYVVIAYSDKHEKDVVLKVGFKKIIDKEIKSLQCFQGNACVKLLAFDQDFSDTNSALLLEYVQPGASLKDLFLQGYEEKVIEIFVDLIKKIQISCDEKLHTNFQTIAQSLGLLKTFQSKNDRLIQLLPQAIELADKLLATQGKQYLLHGDLHHENILQRGNFWVIIDPQGIVGELEYEVGAFIRNPLFELLNQPNLESLILHRFERLSQLLNFDKQRVIDWSFVQAVLAACHAEQDNQSVAEEYFIVVAQLIAKVTHPDYKLEISIPF